jgi:hypothetical protein
MKLLIKTFCTIITFFVVLLLFFGIGTNNKNEDLCIRDIELVDTDFNYENYFLVFDNFEYDINDSKSKFLGNISMNINEFEDIDNISTSSTNNDLNFKFESFYDYSNGTSVLNVYLDEAEETKIIDTIYGIALMDENGNVDVAYDFDGSLILLSEMRNCNTIDTVGWFKKALNKVANKISNTATSAIKVLSTSNGAIGTMCTLAACASVGALCAFIPGGQIVTTVCAGIAGSIVGSVGFQISAELAKKQDASITSDDIANYSVLGGFVGSCVSVASCSSMTSYRNKRLAVKNSCIENKYNSYSNFQKDYGTANSYSIKYGNSSNGKYEWHHIVEQCQIGKSNVVAQDVYSIDNTISLGCDTHKAVSSIYSTNIENLGKYEINGLENLFNNVYGHQTVRSYLSTLSFDEQYSFRIQILKLLGVNL